MSDTTKKESTDLRLGSYTQERWAKEMDASEWMVRCIISQLDKGGGVKYRIIQKVLRVNLGQIIANQDGRPHFFFKLGASIKLEEWLEMEAETDRMDVEWKNDTPRYKLSERMKRLLKYKKVEIDQLIKGVTGKPCISTEVFEGTTS